jgi:hypothetical protein
MKRFGSSRSFLMPYSCRCPMEQHVSVTANDSSSAGLVGKVPVVVHHRPRRLVWAGSHQFSRLLPACPICCHCQVITITAGTQKEWGEAYSTVPLVPLSLVAPLCVAPGDGFFVAASAYNRLNAFLHQKRCRHLTAVLLGTEHRGSTPVALSRQVRARSTFPGNCGFW